MKGTCQESVNQGIRIHMVRDPEKEIIIVMEGISIEIEMEQEIGTMSGIGGREIMEGIDRVLHQGLVQSIRLSQSPEHLA